MPPAEPHMISITWSQDGVTATRTTDQGEAETYACDVHMCSSALCHCTDVNLKFAPTNEAAKAAWPGLDSIDVNVDPYEEMSVEELEDADSAQVSPSTRLAAEFSPETWEELVMQFMDVKANAIDRYEPQVGDYPFSVAAVEGQRQLVSFGEVFQHSVDFVIGRQDKLFTIADLYCLRPACDCAVVVLAMTDAGAADEGEKTEPKWMLSVDLKTGRWSDGQSDLPLSGDALLAKEALMADVPDFFAEAAKRRDLLRRMYALNRPAQMAAAAARKGAKVGRNDPCPCGSGNKFKRCCGL